jgi:hypothetical protein
MIASDRNTSFVTPAKAGVHGKRTSLTVDARFRGHDEMGTGAIA